MKEHGNKKPIYGVGINDADYVTQIKKPVARINGKVKQILVWMCPFYSVWRAMLQRCYDNNYHRRHPTYSDCTLCAEWKLFSNFKAWMEAQDWEGNQLDKDLLIPGNKHYSADTCVFVAKQVNSFLVDRGRGRGKWPLGVYWDKSDQRFRANIANCFTGKNEYLGSFTDPWEAHKAWKKKKHELSCQLADLQTDARVAEALRSRYAD